MSRYRFMEYRGSGRDYTTGDKTINVNRGREFLDLNITCEVRCGI